MLLAYHSDPTTKAKYVKRIKEHQLADQIVRGYGYWRSGKGCAVGCTLHSANHQAYELELGIPMDLALVEDHLFEQMEEERSKDWPLEFLEAIEPGADLNPIYERLLKWAFFESGLIKLPEHLGQTGDWLRPVINYVAFAVDVDTTLLEDTLDPATTRLNRSRVVNLLIWHVHMRGPYRNTAPAVLADKLLELLRSAKVPGNEVREEEVEVLELVEV